MEIDSVYQQKIPVDLTTATSVRIIAMYAEAQRYITGLFFLFVFLSVGKVYTCLFIFIFTCLCL